MNMSGRFTSRMRVAQRSLRSRPTTLRLCANQTRTLLTVQAPLTRNNLTFRSATTSPVSLNNPIQIRTFADKAAQAVGGEVSEQGEDETTEPNKTEEASEEASDVHKRKMSEEIAELQAKIKELEKQSNDFKNAALEYKAEVFNVRKRGQKEVENAQKYAVEKFAKEMLVIADNIDLALKKCRKTWSR